MNAVRQFCSITLIWVSLCGSLRLDATQERLGSEACADCHKQEYERHASSHHAHALSHIGNSAIDAIFLKLGQSPDGAMRYEREAHQISIKEVGLSGDPTLAWAFGAGAQGITPVGRLGDLYFEHQFSYYTRTQRLAPTFGHPSHVSTPMAEVGIVQNGRAISHCFSCHSTGSRDGADGPDLTMMVPGVQCERCHGAGGGHMAAAKSGAPSAVLIRKIANPGRYPAKVLVEFCGQCHRLPPADAVDEPELENPISVRFAPIGLMASRCFRESKSLSCLTCHDPHSNTEPRASMSYSKKCVACHPSMQAKHHGRNQNCLNCHMKQSSLGPNLRFTDHRIRVY